MTYARARMRARIHACTLASLARVRVFSAFQLVQAAAASPLVALVRLVEDSIMLGGAPIRDNA